MTRMGSKKSVIYVLLLLAAVIGLVLDHAHNPRSATAATGDPTTGGLAAPQDTDADLSTTGPQVAGIFDSSHGPSPLQESQWHFDATDEIRDAFTLTPMMCDYYKIQSDRQKQADKDKNEQVQKQHSVQDFQRTYHLKGIVLLPNDAWAIVNDRILRTGDRLGDFALWKIEHYRVVFVRGNVEVVIELPTALDLKSIRQQNDGE